jgi:hypothetical protein
MDKLYKDPWTINSLQVHDIEGRVIEFKALLCRIYSLKNQNSRKSCVRNNMIIYGKSWRYWNLNGGSKK